MKYLCNQIEHRRGARENTQIEYLLFLPIRQHKMAEPINIRNSTSTKDSKKKSDCCRARDSWHVLSQIALSTALLISRGSSLHFPRTDNLTKEQIISARTIKFHFATCFAICGHLPYKHHPSSAKPVNNKTNQTQAPSSVAMVIF